MYINFKPVLQLGKCIVKAILNLVSFRARYYDTSNFGQYRLGLQIDSLDRNRLCATGQTQHQNRELSTQ